MEAVKAERRRPAAAADGAQQRRPLAPSEKNNAVPTTTGRRREPPSRFKPVAPPAPAAARRCSSPSPSPGRASAAADGSATWNNNNNNNSSSSSRARSADRARPAASSLSAPSSRLKPTAGTGRSVTATDVHSSSSSTPPRARNGKASPARSSSPVLLRSCSEHVPSSPATASKVDRLVHGLPSSEQVSMAVAERKRSPRRGSSDNIGVGDQCENARPSNSSVVEKHRWPGMTTGLTSTRAAAARAEKAIIRSVSSSDAYASAGRSPRRTHPSEGSSTAGKGLKRLTNELAKIVHRRRKDKAEYSSSDASSQTSESSKPTCRPPNKAVVVSSPLPALHRSQSARQQQGLMSAASSASSRSCQSPSRMRTSAPCRCQSNSASAAAQSVVEQPVFSYIVDARKGKKNAGHSENVHQLRLLSSRYLQWRFVNAHSEETLSRKNSVESSLYSVWKTVLTLRDALTITRTNARHLQQELKLYDILTGQIGYLEQWPVLEEECNDTLVEATEALKATTLRLPVTSGAQADVIAVRNAISSAVDVMQALSSTIYYMHSKVEDRTSLVSELSVMARQEKVALDQCRDLLAKAAKLQVQETSLRTLLMQLQQREIFRMVKCHDEEINHGFDMYMPTPAYSNILLLPNQTGICRDE